jgi:hypothetical protein
MLKNFEVTLVQKNKRNPHTRTAIVKAFDGISAYGVAENSFKGYTIVGFVSLEEKAKKEQEELLQKEKIKEAEEFMEKKSEENNNG